MTASKKIAFFSIPAHGHTNPMIPVARELINRGNNVRFYSFDEFEERIKASGAEFVSCSKFLPEITEKEEEGLKKVSTTEMSIQDIRITLSMNDFLQKEFESFRPDVVFSDSVCFWGKLNAWKFGVPLVVSTTTFAFNQLSSSYMKKSPAELADMIFGLSKVGKELKTLEPYGYKVKSTLSLVQSDNETDSVVYTSRRFQPYAASYSDHYTFVGPSVYTDKVPNKKNARPLLYISMGTVLNERPDFYKNCIAALKDSDIDVIISCGKQTDIKSLGTLPENFKVYPYVDQLDVLSRANAFITHCGMNSASESLYMAAPMVLFPQTGEQHAVARRVYEIGAGTYLKSDSPEDIRKAVDEILANKSYADAAEEGSRDFRSCPGAAGAAEFLENAPKKSNGFDFFKELNKANRKFQTVYWAVMAAVIVLVGVFIGWKFAPCVGIPAGFIAAPIGKVFQSKYYNKYAGQQKL